VLHMEQSHLLTHDDIQGIVLAAMAATNEAREPDRQLAVLADAPLFGSGSPLDSLGLVGLLVDVEDALRDRGLEVELSDARAMSQTRSPFRDVPALVAYIDGLQARHA
jgi:acyl carrier protein